MDAYVFLKEAPEEILLELLGEAEKRGESEPGVRFVSRLYGAFDAVVAVVAPSFVEIQTVIDGLRSLGINRLEVAVPVDLPPPPPVPVYGNKLVNALSLITVAPEQGPHVLEVLAKLPGTRGLALTAGITDILVELGGETFEELSRTLVDDVAQISGITGISTSFLPATVA